MFYTIFNTGRSTSRQEGRVKTLGTLSDQEYFHPTPLERDANLNCRFALSNKFTGTHLYTWVTVIMSEVSCPRKEHNDSSESLNPEHSL